MRTGGWGIVGGANQIKPKTRQSMADFSRSVSLSLALALSLPPPHTHVRAAHAHTYTHTNGHFHEGIANMYTPTPTMSFQCPPFPPSLPANCCGPPSGCGAASRHAPGRWPALHAHGRPPSPGADVTCFPSTQCLPFASHQLPLPLMRRWQSTRYGTACQPTCASMFVRQLCAT